MKKQYITFCFAILSTFGFAQTYEFGIVHVSNYDFKVVAIPDFTSNGNTDISDVGFALVLPAGSVDVANATAALPGRVGTAIERDAAFLTGLGLGDGTKDVFEFNIPPGQTLLAHNAGQQIDIFNFQITNMPTSDQMYFLLNTDPIAMGAGGVLDSFYNANIDLTPDPDTVLTLNYFSMLATGLDNFMFNTLSVEEIILDDSSIQIYPNPTSDVINISSDYQIQSVELFNITGKRVVKIKQTKQIKVKQFSAGIYLIRIKSNQGLITKKIIIK